MTISAHADDGDDAPRGRLASKEGHTANGDGDVWREGDGARGGEAGGGGEGVPGARKNGSGSRGTRAQLGRSHPTPSAADGGAGRAAREKRNRSPLERGERRRGAAQGGAGGSGANELRVPHFPMKQGWWNHTLDLRPELLSSESESEKALDLERLMGDDGAG